MVFFFNDTATTEIYTLSLHDALPTSAPTGLLRVGRAELRRGGAGLRRSEDADDRRGVADLPGEHPLHRLVERSEEHTSELQSRQYLVCRLLLEKKNQ